MGHDVFISHSSKEQEQSGSRPPRHRRGWRIAALLAVVTIGLAAALAWRGDLSRLFAGRPDRSSATAPSPTAATLGTVERLDPALDALLPPDANLEVLLERQGGAAAPVWSTPENCLYFADVSQDAVYRWSESGGAAVYLQPAGYAGPAPRGAGPAANALALHPDGRLTLAERGARRVGRLDRGYTARAKVTWTDRVSPDGKGADRLISQAVDVLTSREIPILVARDKELQAVHPSLAGGRDLDDPAVQQDVIRKLRDVAAADLSTNLRTVDLRVTRPDPVEASHLANAFARALVRWCQSQMRGDIDQQIAQLDETCKNNQMLRSALQVARTKLMVDNKVDADALKRDNALAMAAKLAADHFAARVALAAAEAKLRTLQGDGLLRPDQPLNPIKMTEEEKQKDAILQAFNQQLVAAVGLMESKRLTQAAEHPDIRRALDQVNRMKAQVLEREAQITAVTQDRIKKQFDAIEAKTVAEAEQKLEQARQLVDFYNKQLAELDDRTKTRVYVKGQVAALDDRIALVSRDFDATWALLQDLRKLDAAISANTGIKVAEYAAPPPPAATSQAAAAAAIRPAGTFHATLADRYEGKRLNGPHALTYDSKGDLLFTDAPHGPDDPERDLTFQGVYRLPEAGKLTLLTKALKFPSGLALSPDERTLYVADADPDRPAIHAFNVAADGTIDRPRVLFDAAAPSSPRSPGMPAGLTVDAAGNLWASAAGNILIVSPAGKHLGTIATGQRTANCAWGGADGATLYVTADTHLCRIKTTPRRQ